MHVVAGKPVRNQQMLGETQFRQPGKSFDIDEPTNMTNTSHHTSRNVVSPSRTANL